MYSGRGYFVVDLCVRFAWLHHPAIQTAAEWGKQTSVTPVLETEQISRPLLWTPSLLRPLKHRPVSTLISPETTSICRMGTACYVQDPRAVGTASACVVSHYFCPFWLCYLSGKLVRESDKLGGLLGFLSVEAYLALRAGDKKEYWFIHIVVMQNQSKFPHMYIFIWHDCICAHKYNRTEAPFYKYTNTHTVSKYLMLTQLQNKGTESLRSFWISYLVCFAHEIAQTWRWL